MEWDIGMNSKRKTNYYRSVGELFLKDLWRDSVGLKPIHTNSVTDSAKYSLNELKRTEWSMDFENALIKEIIASGFSYERYILERFCILKPYMKNRLIQGAFRYGLLSSDKPKWDRYARVELEIARFREDYLCERIVDALNMMLLEWVENGRDNEALFQAAGLVYICAMNMANMRCLESLNKINTSVIHTSERI